MSKKQTIAILPRDPNKVLVTLHTPRLPRRNDSMFYYDKHIATVTRGNRKIIVESAGEIQAYFDENGDCYENEMLAKELESRGLTDRTLSKLGQNDMIQMNNWFRIVEVADNEKHSEDIAHTFDDAIAVAKSILK